MVKKNSERKIIISIIIPIYNAENFIETAIRSILRQTQPWLEIILINDGSTDSSEEICKKYVSNQVLYYSIKNSGAGCARNFGIKLSKGEWILFLDSDDLILEGFFSIDLYNYLIRMYKKSIDIIYTPKIECDMELSKLFRIEFPEKTSEIEHFLPKLEFCTCIYNADFLKNKNIMFFEFKKQDIESAFRFRAFSNAKNILVDDNRIFYIRRNNPTSNTNTLNYYNYYEIKGIVYYKLFEEFDDREINTTVWLYMQYLYHLKQMIILCFNKGATDDNLKQLRNLISKISNKSKRVLINKLPPMYLIFVLLIFLFKSPPLFSLFVIISKKKKKTDIKTKKVEIPISKDNIDQVFFNMQNIKIPNK